MKLKKGQKVTLPRLGGYNPNPYANKRRKATVLGDYGSYYMFQVANGYRECYLKTDLEGIRLA